MVTPDGETIELHDLMMRGATDLLIPYLHFGPAPGKPSVAAEGRAGVLRACEMLERVIEMNPGNWSAMWLLGKGRDLLDQTEAAYEAFKGAYRLNGENPNVGRELMLVCMTLDRPEETLRISEHVISLSPNDPGLLANHTLALLMNSQVPEALATITRALELDPNDPGLRNVYSVAVECQTGQRPLPLRLPR